MTPKSKHHITWLDVAFYADKKAIEATRDLPRDGNRLLVFSRVWSEATKEYVNAYLKERPTKTQA